MKTYNVWYMFPDEYFMDTVQANNKQHAIEVSLINGGDRKRISCVEEAE